MRYLTFSAGSLAFDGRYYQLNVIAPGKTIELVDLRDRERSCVLSSGETYYLRLRSRLAEGAVFVHKAGEDVHDASLPLLTVQKSSAFAFHARKLLASARRHALRNFGPGEKLIAKPDSRHANLAKSAGENVEFRALRLYGLDDRSIQARHWPWMAEAWPVHASSPDVADPESFRKKACIYVHMHYWQTWDEIERVLLNECLDLDLIVTSTEGREQEFERILSRFPRSRIIVTDNRGRDVGPFIQLLKDGIFDGYCAVCKIHGKLSLKNGRETLSGVRIRRYILASLLADGACARALAAFRDNETLGMLGPRELYLPRSGKAGRYIKTERKQISRILRLAKAEHLDMEEIRFFVGTMFWFRPAALGIIQRAGIGISDFDAENGAKRNTLQHGMERVFGRFVQEAGYDVGCLHPGEAEGIQVELEYS